MKSASKLSQDGNCFKDCLYVQEEESYGELADVCSKTQPYSLQNILVEHEIPLDQSADWSKKTDLVSAFAIATFESESSGVTIINTHDDKFKAAITTNLAVISNRQVFPTEDLALWMCDIQFQPDVAVYSFTTTNALSNEDDLKKALNLMQHDSIPLLIIENRSGKRLLSTARQFAIKCIELFRLRRCYGDSSPCVVGFILPDLEDEAPQSNSASDEKLEKRISQLKLEKDEIPLERQNLAIKVTVGWNSMYLKFDIKYDVLNCDQVMESIHLAIENQRGRQLDSKGNFDYFFRLTSEELEEVKDAISKVSDALLKTCDFTQPLQQFPSCVSFVFGLSSGYIFKAFPRSTVEREVEVMEKSIRQLQLLEPSKMLLSLLSFQTLIVTVDTQYFVFERLHQISRDVAKQCLKQVLTGAKEAIDNLHSFEAAHLDVRLPNICFKVNDECKKEGTVMLIDLERSKKTPSKIWKDKSYISCMYRLDFSYRQIDYVQLYWMAFWILLPDAFSRSLDYHDMDDDNYLDTQKLDEPLYQMRKFIKELPAQHATTQWEKFQTILHAAHHEDSISLFDAVTITSNC